MENEIIRIKEGGGGCYEEKKSKFFAAVYSVENEEEALALIEAAQKKYWDARHNCYAFVIGDNNELTRCSDDGEPSGTAGKPILEVILANKVHNCLIVVTRYFGGTLLGTGGLVRAYRRAAADGLEKSRLVKRLTGSRLTVAVDYNSDGKIRYAAEKNKYIVEDTVYGADVRFVLQVPKEQVGQAIAQFTQLTAGKAVITEEEGIGIDMEI